MKTSMISGLMVGTALLLGSVGVASAQGPNYGRSPAALEGTWDVVITPYACSNANVTFPSFRSRLMFNAGGTMVESPFNPSFQPGQRNLGLGYWKRTGQTSFHAVFEAYINLSTPVTDPPTRPSYTRGVQRVDQTIEMHDADNWTSSADVSFFNEAGAPVSAGCMTAAATRAL